MIVPLGLPIKSLKYMTITLWGWLVLLRCTTNSMFSKIQRDQENTLP